MLACACDATAWRIEAASCGFGEAFAAGTEGGGTGAPGDGRRYIASIVGRNAAPNGVDRKSVGRSKEMESLYSLEMVNGHLPLIKGGIVLPVRKPTQSSVNELQLKSKSKDQSLES